MRKREGEVWHMLDEWEHVILITSTERASKDSYTHVFVYLASKAPEMVGRVGRYGETRQASWETSWGMERVA